MSCDAISHAVDELGFLSVPSQSGMEFALSTAAHMVLCSEFVADTVLIALQVLGSCQNQFARHQGFLFSPC